MMTPMAQQSTGRPYRCRPTTSGAKKKIVIYWLVTSVAIYSSIYTHFLEQRLLPYPKVSP